MAIIKTPAEIAETVLDEHAIQPHWNRSGAQIALLIEEAIEADRKQRPEVSEWLIYEEAFPNYGDNQTGTEEVIEELVRAYNADDNNCGKTFNYRKAGE